MVVREEEESDPSCLKEAVFVCPEVSLLIKKVLNLYGCHGPLFRFLYLSGLLRASLSLNITEVFSG